MSCKGLRPSRSGDGCGAGRGAEGAGGGGAYEPVVPHPREAFGQDVDDPAADELVGMEGEDAGLIGFPPCPVEADVAALVVANNPSGADGAALHVTGEVAHGGVAAPDVLELHVPCLVGQEGGYGGGRGSVTIAVLLGVCFLRDAPERAIGSDRRAGKWRLAGC